MEKYHIHKCAICGHRVRIPDDPEIAFTAFCHQCGWNPSPKQEADHTLEEDMNRESFDDHKGWYEEQLEDNPNFNFYKDIYTKKTPHPCPVCGKYTFKNIASYDICPFCGWEDDDSTDWPDEGGGANDLSFNYFKERYNETILKNPKYKWEKDGNFWNEDDVEESERRGALPGAKTADVYFLNH